METMHEIIPFAKEMLAQKPSRRMLKVYLVGTVVAFLGMVLGLVETVCQSFSSGEPLDAELVQLMAREQRALETEERRRHEEVATVSAAEQITIPRKLQQATGAHRGTGAANRLHAS